MEIRLIKIAFAFTFLIFISCGDCPVYECDELAEDFCFVPQPPSPSTNYKMQKCSLEHQICQVTDPKGQNSVRCADVLARHVKVFPGASCKSEAYCYNESCMDGICAGLQENARCTMATTCYYGYTCREGKDQDKEKYCLPPLKEGDKCVADTDCESSCGCLNSKCTKYFSLPEESHVHDSSCEPEASMLSFCKSGYDYHGVCKKWLNFRNPEPCDESHPCKYIDYNGSPTFVPENCECGYSLHGHKYCPLGSNEVTFQEYVRATKELFLNNPNCHLSERGGDYCSKELQINSEEIQKKHLKHKQLKIMALRGHQLIDSDECTLNVLFPDFFPIVPKPVVPQCPKYECLANQSNCVFSPASSLDRIKVTLSDICSEKQYCEPREDPTTGKEVKGSCTPIVDKVIYRYPGEVCQIDADCWYPAKEDPRLGKCVDLKCIGYKEGEECTATEMCEKGNYCNLKTKKCEKQIELNQPCNNPYDCVNKYVCYEGMCQDKYYTMPAGFKYNVIDHVQDIPINYLCEFGLSKDDQCVKVISSAPVDPTSNLTLCEYGSTCSYEYEPSTLGTLEMKCQCGINAKGKSYCPKPFNSEPELWKQYFDSLKKQYDNTCHSQNRFSCYQVDEALRLTTRRNYNKVFMASSFAGAVDCAEKVLTGVPKE